MPKPESPDPSSEPRLFIGTSGWSYPEWKGSFYPKDVPRRKFLEYYATRFPATELNASFYRLPTDKMLDAWLERTPDEFRFCCKLSRLITHQKKLNDPADALSRFFERFESLLGRMAPVLAQLPPSLAFDSDRVETFLAAYRDVSELPLAIEARHASWFENEALEVLESGNVALVRAESGGRWPETDAVTADFAYLRFHGPKELYASGYTPQKLGQVAGRVAAHLQSGMDVHAFFNNTDGGYAWRDAEKLAELVKKRM